MHFESEICLIQMRNEYHTKRKKYDIFEMNIQRMHATTTTTTQWRYMNVCRKIKLKSRKSQNEINHWAHFPDKLTNKIELELAVVYVVYEMCYRTTSDSIFVALSGIIFFSFCPFNFLFSPINFWLSHVFCTQYVFDSNSSERTGEINLCHEYVGQVVSIYHTLQSTYISLTSLDRIFRIEFCRG